MQTAGTDLKPDGGPLTRGQYQYLPLRAILRSFCFKDNGLVITAEPIVFRWCLSLVAGTDGYTTFPLPTPLPLNLKGETSRSSHAHRCNRHLAPSNSLCFFTMIRRHSGSQLLVLPYGTLLGRHRLRLAVPPKRHDSYILTQQRFVSTTLSQAATTANNKTSLSSFCFFVLSCLWQITFLTTTARR